MQDVSFIKLLRKNPDAGMKRLLEQYGGLVYSVTRGKLLMPPFTSEDIEDCVADTFIEFYDKLFRYEPARGSIKAWLCTIARNKAIDRLRERYTAPETVSLEETSRHPVVKSPENDLLSQEDKARLLNAIQTLGEPDRQIILRKYYLSQPSREIAERLGMTISNVDTRTHRAIEKLRKQLEVNPHE